MELVKFLKEIKFKFISINTKTSEDIEKRFPVEEEIMNTELPEYNEKTEFIKKICPLPKMSTFAVGSIINKIVSELKPDEYFVNIGVWCGFTFFSGVIGNKDKNCVAVDNFSEFYPEVSRPTFYQNFNANFSSLPNIKFFEEDYEDYFLNFHKGKIGFYIYDGEHSYKNQLRGLEIAEPFFSDRCIILVDDTNEPDVKKSVFDFMEKSKNKYELIFDVNTINNCHPTFWNGIMIFRRV